MAENNKPKNNRPERPGNPNNKAVPPNSQPYDQYDPYDSPTQNFYQPNPLPYDYEEDFQEQMPPPNAARQGYNPSEAGNSGNNYYPQPSDYGAGANRTRPSGYNRPSPTQGQPYQQGWSAPPEPDEYQPPAGNMPPNRRGNTGGYRPYQPPMPGSARADADDDYEGPPPSYNVTSSRSSRFAPPINPSARPYNWNAPPPTPPVITRSATSKLIPIVIGLIAVVVILLAVVIILLLGKNKTNNNLPTVVVQNPAATVTVKPTATTNLLTTVTGGNATATLATTTTSVAVVGTPTIPANGSPTPTPGAGPLTQLAQYNATLTAQMLASPTLSATPATLGTPSPSVAASGTASNSLTALPSVSIAPSDVEQLYQSGLQALNQAQWQTAINALEQVIAAQPQYKDTPTLLAQAYTEQGKASVNNANTTQDILAARQYFDKALIYKPNDPVIKRLEQELDFYYNGRVQYEGNNWQQAINNFAPLYKLEPNYKDNVQLLYSAYLNQGDLQINQNKLMEAANNYKAALALPVTDNSLAQQKLTQIQLLLTPTATPIPSATPSPIPPTPTPTPQLVNGCVIGTFNFGPFEVASTNSGSGADQGQGSLAGLVVDLNNQPLGGATVLITSSNGRYSFKAVTNPAGRYAVSGVLGRDNWTVKLINAPGISICYSQPAYVFVNGQAEGSATANFVETRP